MSKIIGSVPPVKADLVDLFERINRLSAAADSCLRGYEELQAQARQAKRDWDQAVEELQEAIRETRSGRTLFEGFIPDKATERPVPLAASPFLDTR